MRGGRRRRVAQVALALLGVAALALVVGALLARPAPDHPWFAPRPGERRPLVMAHQGGEGIRPSNTMLAFQRAVDLGVDVLDTDMHVTRDGVLVLLHDQTVDRTTNGRGAVRDLTLAEIKALDAGYSFTLDGGQTYPYRGQGLTIPTLEELFQAFPAIRYGIEIKETPPDVATSFCALIRRYGKQGQVLVSSFWQPNIEAFRRACPEVATSGVESEIRTFYVLYRLGLAFLYSPPYHSLQIPEASGGIQLLEPGFIQAAHSRGLRVQPWTINEAADLQRIAGLGVDGINTDYPDRLIDILAVRRP